MPPPAGCAASRLADIIMFQTVLGEGAFTPSPAHLACTARTTSACEAFCPKAAITSRAATLDAPGRLRGMSALAVPRAAPAPEMATARPCLRRARTRARNWFTLRPSDLAWRVREASLGISFAR